MKQFTFESHNETDTDRFGAALAEVVPDGTTVALCGTLGAGKTRLVEAVAAASGISRDEVVSPTFVLCQQYNGRRTINHMDAYRIRDEDEFMELGPDEYFDSPAISFVEWADRVSVCMPAERLEIQIEVTGDTSRRFVVTATNERFDETIASLTRLMNAD